MPLSSDGDATENIAEPIQTQRRLIAWTFAWNWKQVYLGHFQNERPGIARPWRFETGGGACKATDVDRATDEVACLRWLAARDGFHQVSILRYIYIYVYICIYIYIFLFFS